MKRLALLTVLSVVPLTSCTGVPGLEHPEVKFAPHYAALQVRGSGRMQTSTNGVITNPAAVPLRDGLGAGSRDDGYGGTLRAGDGFSGLELGYVRLDSKSTQAGQLPDAFGALAAGDAVRTRLEFDEWRLRYVGKVLEFETAQALKLQFGLGAMLTLRNLDLHAAEVSGARRQRIEVEDQGLPYLCGRGRAFYQGFGLQVDYGLNPDVRLGGDFEGLLHDYAVTLSWTVPHQDATLFAGYRRSDLEANGLEQSLNWDLDLTLDGFVVGVEVTF